MKINEKSLALYAGSGAPPDREGYLQKRGDFNKGFQKRWCVLKGNLLFYYDKRTDKDPIGVIVLEGCTIELSDHDENFTFIIQFPSHNLRTYILAADTQEEMEAWMKVLSCASYDYMKLCVSELRSQLQDLEANSGRRLVQSAIDDSYHPPTDDSHDNCVIELPSNTHGGHRRNPFDSSDSLDDASPTSPGSLIVEKRARSFLEMHNEFRKQINEVLMSWLQKQKQSSMQKHRSTEV